MQSTLVTLANVCQASNEHFHFLLVSFPFLTDSRKTKQTKICPLRQLFHNSCVNDMIAVHTKEHVGTNVAPKAALTTPNSEFYASSKPERQHLTVFYKKNISVAEIARFPMGRVIINGIAKKYFKK